ncbi:hypothetical protein D3C85_1729590 [compost metagenome]
MASPIAKNRSESWLSGLEDMAGFLLEQLKKTDLGALLPALQSADGGAFPVLGNLLDRQALAALAPEHQALRRSHR